MKSTVVALALLGAVLFPVTSTAQEDAQKGRAQLDAARELYAAGNWDTAREAYAEAYALAPEKSVLKAEVALEWSSLLWEQGYYLDAEKRVKDALERAKKLKLDHALGRLMLTLGHIEASRGKFSAAESTLRICVKMTQEARDDNFTALCRMNLRFVRRLQGKSVPPQSQYRRDLKTLEKSGSPLLVGTALAKSAELQEKAGDTAGALALLNEAQKHFASSDSVPARARNRLRVVQTLQTSGRWAEARKELDGLVSTFANMNNRPALVTAWVLEGKQAEHEGNSAKAQKAFQKAHALSRKLQSPHIQANVELALCEFHAAHGGSVDKVCAQAARRFDAAGVPELAARAVVIQARHAQTNEQLTQARLHYVEAIERLENKVAPSARNPRQIAIQHVNLCQVEMRLEANGAQKRCRDAHKALEKVKNKDADYRGMLAATHYALGGTASDKQHDAAIEHFKKAAKLYVSLDNVVMTADTKLRLGRALRDAKKPAPEAAREFEQGLGFLEKAKADDPRVPTLRVELRTQLGQALLDAEAWADAKKILEALVADSATSPYNRAWGYSALARAHLKLGDRDEARKALEQGARFAKQSKDAELEASIRKNLERLK